MNTAIRPARWADRYVEGEMWVCDAHMPSDHYHRELPAEWRQHPCAQCVALAREALGGHWAPTWALIQASGLSYLPLGERHEQS